MPDSDLSSSTLILTADHHDKAAYPTRAFPTTGIHLPDVLIGEVVWIGRHLGHSHPR